MRAMQHAALNADLCPLQPRTSSFRHLSPFPLCIRRRFSIPDSLVSRLHVARKKSLKSTKNAALVKTSGVPNPPLDPSSGDPVSSHDSNSFSNSQAFLDDAAGHKPEQQPGTGRNEKFP